jgi:CRP-like cAMP-binding protein
MFSIFKEFVSNKITLTTQEWEKIRSVCIDKKLRKKEFLLKEGEMWRYSAFVCTGCIRTYRLDDDGYEHIINFSKELWWAGESESLSTGKPSKYYIDAIEDSEICLFLSADFDMLCMEIPKLSLFMNNNVKECMGAIQNRINVAISYNTEEKYRDFLTEHPGLSSRVPQYMIASYLGITPESLSRLRKQLVRS